MIARLWHMGVIGVAILVAVVVSIITVCFLGGLASAAWEVSRERKAGKIPTRPAWELRAKKRAVGRFYWLRSAWEQSRHRFKLDVCWCARGPVQRFEEGGNFPAGYGCAAWEAGDPLAIVRHDAAGGYARTPDLDAFNRLALVEDEREWTEQERRYA